MSNLLPRKGELGYRHGDGRKESLEKIEGLIETGYSPRVSCISAQLANRALIALCSKLFPRTFV